MQRVISNIYKTLPRKRDVNKRRINRETMRHKLAVASFISVPRLLTAKFDNHPQMVREA